MMESYFHLVEYMIKLVQMGTVRKWPDFWYVFYHGTHIMAVNKGPPYLVAVDLVASGPLAHVQSRNVPQGMAKSPRGQRTHQLEYIKRWN